MKDKKDETITLDLTSEGESTKPSIKTPNEKFKNLDHIPCLYLPYDEGSNKIIVYFHGNAEDIGLAFDLMYLVG